MAVTGKPIGRPKGAKGKLSDALSKRCKREGCDPADVLIDIMQKARASGDTKMAYMAAKELMPYVHPRLSTLDMSMTGAMAPVTLQVVARDDGEYRSD